MQVLLGPGEPFQAEDAGHPGILLVLVQQGRLWGRIERRQESERPVFLPRGTAVPHLGS